MCVYEVVAYSPKIKRIPFRIFGSRWKYPITVLLLVLNCKTGGKTTSKNVKSGEPCLPSFHFRNYALIEAGMFHDKASAKSPTLPQNTSSLPPHTLPYTQTHAHTHTQWWTGIWTQLGSWAYCTLRSEAIHLCEPFSEKLPNGGKCSGTNLLPLLVIVMGNKCQW